MLCIISTAAGPHPGPQESQRTFPEFSLRPPRTCTRAPPCHPPSRAVRKARACPLAAAQEAAAGVQLWVRLFASVEGTMWAVKVDPGCWLVAQILHCPRCSTRQRARGKHIAGCSTHMHTLRKWHVHTSTTQRYKSGYDERLRGLKCPPMSAPCFNLRHKAPIAKSLKHEEWPSRMPSAPFQITMRSRPRTARVLEP